MIDEHLSNQDSPRPLAVALGEALDQAGFRHALAPVSVAEVLFQEVAALRDRGLLADNLYSEYHKYWRFVAPAGVAEPRTLIVVAWPSLPARVRFQLQGGPLDAVVPPTYISAEGRSRLLEVASSVLAPAGHGVGWARVPVKLLAVRTGLAQYGRNNIAYVAGMGSCARMAALCTDADLGAGASGAGAVTDALGGAREGVGGHSFMDRCVSCHACQHACPTDCIPEDGTVIDAAHCLTRASESEGAWPSWVPAQSHNSLVGCMRCQEVCPVDRPYLGKEPDLVAEFDREETALILDGRPVDQLPDALRAKLEGLDLDEYSSVLGRNLAALSVAAALRSSGLDLS